MNTLPKLQLIIGYRDVFGENPPEDRLSLLVNCSREVIMAEICGLNYRLKPKVGLCQDTTKQTQFDELLYFSGGAKPIFQQMWYRVARFFQNENDYGLIFNRAGCLFAIEEILQSELTVIPEFSMEFAWEQLFKYLLAVNNKITYLTNNPHVNKDEVTIETISPKIIPLNELSICLNPLHAATLGYRLLGFLQNHQVLGEHFVQYMQEKYAMNYERFIYELVRMYFANNINGENNFTNQATGKEIDLSFHYYVKDPADIAFFEQLSGIYNNESVEKLISVKKFPLYKIKDNVYMLMDNQLAIDKCYNQFINDFWFDCVKQIKEEDGKAAYKMQYYRSVIGYFLEDYCRQILSFCFANVKYWIVKSFDELKVNHHGQEIELSDIYVRSNKKIFIAEVKSTGLYDDAKFSGDVQTFYKSGRDEFFKSFGLDQLVKSIQNLAIYGSEIDENFPKEKAYRIYPAVVVNEKALQTPLMGQIFNQRFQEMIVPIRDSKVTISPLAVIHISDLEQIQEDVKNQSNVFWDILKFHVREPRFMPPFYNSIIRKNNTPHYSKVMKLYEYLIGKYSPSVPL